MFPILCYDLMLAIAAIAMIYFNNRNTPKPA